MELFLEFVLELRLRFPTKRKLLQERASMKPRRPMRKQPRLVLGGSIADIGKPIIVAVEIMEVAHLAIAHDFGDDAGRRHLPGIAVRLGLDSLLALEVLNGPITVDDEQGSRGEPLDGLTRRFLPSLGKADSVDPFSTREAKAEMACLSQDLRHRLLSLRGGEHLRISIERVTAHLRWKSRDRDDQRTGPSAGAHFIKASDDVALGQKSLLSRFAA